MSGKQRIVIKDLPKNQMVSESEADKVLGGLKSDFSSYYYFSYSINRMAYPGVIFQQGRVLQDNDWND